jgi:hypothetical protein
LYTLNRSQLDITTAMGFTPPETMRAVVLKSDFKARHCSLLPLIKKKNTDCCYQVAVEDRPYPKIQKPTDAVLKVSSTALCGSDLHFYRGHLKCPPDFICGQIVEKGDEVSKFNIGDKVRNFGADWE